MSEQARRLIPASEWAEHHPWPSRAGVRHLIANAKTNGFDKVIRRVWARGTVGKGWGRILIDEQEFFKWVDEKNEEANAASCKRPR